MPYPGSDANAYDIARLAAEYPHAATVILVHDERREILSLAPVRMLTVHAIELYLHAFLVAVGVPPVQIRGFQHDFASKVNLAGEKGLILRRKTARHISTIAERREYLVLRYEPEQMTDRPELNRVLATLKELAEKVMPAVSAAALTRT
jgi:hypothetical protein